MTNHGFIDLWMIRLYWRKRDWAGIGRAYRMVAWTWNGMPRSIVL